MNWLNTNAHKAQGNCLLLLTCLILSCIVPVVFCQEEDTSTQNEPHTNGEISLQHSKVHWTHYDNGGRHLSGERTIRMKSNTIHRHHKEGFLRTPKGHGKHKKQTRNRNKLHKDFGGISQENAKKNHLNYLESEKKYFDYFPVEDTHKNLVPLRDEDVEVVLLLNDTNIREKLLKSPSENKIPKKISRSKREIPEEESYIRPNFDYVRNFVATEQDIGRPPVVGLTKRITRADQYYSQGTVNDPWNNRFTQPVNSFYLPIPRPYTPVSATNIKYPIPGLYYNAISPAGTYPIIRRTNRPSVGSRFGEEEDRVIWDIRYVGAVERPGNAASAAAEPPSIVAGGFGGSSSGFPAQTTTRAPPQNFPTRVATRAPAPPLIHMDKRGSRGSTQSPNDRTNSFNIPQTQAPSIMPRPTQRPTIRTTTRKPGRSEPSKCVWAIVACCSRNDLKVRYNCFEQIGCHGAFWDYNPCADNFQDAALNEADIFFQP